MFKLIGITALSSLLIGAAWGADEDYEFVLDTNRWVVVPHGKSDSLGKLDKEGNFHPDPRWINVREGSYPSHAVLNFPSGKAYEYRSGRLVLGELDEEGNFIPKLYSKVIDFKDYRFSETATRIYNLPGKFVKKKDKDAKK
jgi:hypothetical protein